MGKIQLILGASILLLVSAQVNANVINATNTNTEYSPGLFADLQGLEWLSIDETLGQSVDSILGGYGGFIDDHWRYANREETSILLNSISGGISGVSNDPLAIAGASWFMSNIANDDRYLTYSGFYSYFIYNDMGDDVPCRPYDPVNYCLGRLGTQNETNVSGDISAAQFGDKWGLDPSIYVLDVAKDFAFPLYGSLLVRSEPCSGFPGGGATGGEFPGGGATGGCFPGKVPEPAAFWLFGTGLIGLIGFTRRRRVA